jgi:hypothetical protein
MPLTMPGTPATCINICNESACTQTGIEGAANCCVTTPVAEAAELSLSLIDGTYNGSKAVRQLRSHCIGLR